MNEKHLEFKVANKYFAYPIALIREIMEYPQIESIAGAPSFILGVMNLRGRLVVVFDIAPLLSLPTVPVGAKTCVIVTEVKLDGDTYVIANKVDLVRQVVDVQAQQLETVPQLGGQLDTPLIKGVAKLDNRLLTVLNVNNLLSEELLNWVNHSISATELGVIDD